MKVSSVLSGSFGVSVEASLALQSTDEKVESVRNHKAFKVAFRTGLLLKHTLVRSRVLASKHFNSELTVGRLSKQ